MPETERYYYIWDLNELYWLIYQIKTGQLRLVRDGHDWFRQIPGS